MHRTATISIFLSVAKCGPICRAQTCAHSGVETSRSTKGFPRGWPKSSKKFRIVHHFETLRPYISQTVKIEAYQQHTEKSFIPPLSNCRICMDSSLTGRKYRNGEKCEIFSNFLAHSVETPGRPWRFYTRMCAGLCPTYWTTFGIAEKNILSTIHWWIKMNI